MSPEEFYEEVMVGDFVELYYPDETKTIKVAGVLHAEDSVKVLSTGGMLFSLRQGNSARIIHRTSIRRHW